MPRRPRVPAFLAAATIALIAAGGLRAATPAAAVSTEQVRALRARAAELFERREEARMVGGVSMEALGRDLAQLAADLEAAKLDSLASSAHYRTAGVLNRLSRNAEAERHLHQAVAAALRAKATRAEMNARVALVMTSIERRPELGLRASRALAPRLRSLGLHQNLGTLRAGEARAWMEMGRWSEALVAAREAAALYGRIGNRVQRANALTQCSQALRFLGRTGEALSLTDSVIAIGRAQPIGGTMSRALLERTAILRALGRDDEALVAVSEALAVDRRRGDLRGVWADRMFRANALIELKRPAAALADLDTLRRELVATESRAASVRVGALRARALRDVGRADEADSTLARELAEYERWRATLVGDEDRTAAAEHAALGYALWARLRADAGHADQAWAIAEHGRASALEQRVGGDDVPDLAALQARLRRAKAALVQFDVASELGNVFVLNGESVRAIARTRGASASDVRTTVAAFASAGGRPNAATLDRLSRALFAEMWGAWPAGIERVVIVPPSGMETLPLERLPAPGGRLLGDRAYVSYAPSAGTLVALDARRADARGLTIVADPQVDPKLPVLAALDQPVRGAVLRGLPGARAEAKRLAEPGATVLVGRDATLARLRAAPPAGVLHLAAHHVAGAPAAGRGGLVLAGAEPLLTPARAESLGIAADLVTLSGCGTLGNTVYAGEGAYGLARGFLVGGARSVVTTRWDVGDRAASRFMQHFYDALRAGRARDASLAEASRALVREGFPARDAHAFLLIGVPDEPVERWRKAATGR